jgi:hypothetical protein
MPTPAFGKKGTAKGDEDAFDTKEHMSARERVDELLGEGTEWWRLLLAGVTLVAMIGGFIGFIYMMCSSCLVGNQLIVRAVCFPFFYCCGSKNKSGGKPKGHVPQSHIGTEISSASSSSESAPQAVKPPPPEIVFKCAFRDRVNAIQLQCSSETIDYTATCYFHTQYLKAIESVRVQSKYVDCFRYEPSVSAAQATASAVASAEYRIAEQQKSARTSGVPAQKHGFIYIFRSDQDDKVCGVPLARLNSTTPWLYKIGKTTQVSASARVAEWHNAVFRNQEGVGWWRTNDTTSAEELIHALLQAVRMVRVNSISNHTEIEWFATDYETAKTTIVFVIAAMERNDPRSLLIAAAVANNGNK